VALEETEVLEIRHDSMKQVFDANPELVASLSHIIAERRQVLATKADTSTGEPYEPAGLLSAIKRFFGLN